MPSNSLAEGDRKAGKRPSGRARILQAIGWVALGLVIAVYIGLPITMAVAAVWPSRARVAGPPAGFEEVELTTSDGVRLSAWYAPSSNGAAVIIAHGAGGSRESVKSLARMLAQYGYGVLAMDLRGHGTSDGRTNRLGWAGTRDVRAAVDYLVAQDETVRIGGVGLSMGGEVLLGASAECPEIRAVVADGATRRCAAELSDLPSERSLVRSFTARVMYAAVALLAREAPPTPLLHEMSRSQATRFMLIAAAEKELEVAFNERFAQLLGRRAELWVVPGVAHTGARARYPADYDRRVLGFLDSQLRR